MVSAHTERLLKGLLWTLGAQTMTRRQTRGLMGVWQVGGKRKNKKTPPPWRKGVKKVFHNAEVCQIFWYVPRTMVQLLLGFLLFRLGNNWLSSLSRGFPPRLQAKPFMRSHGPPSQLFILGSSHGHQGWKVFEEATCRFLDLYPLIKFWLMRNFFPFYFFGPVLDQNLSLFSVCLMCVYLNVTMISSLQSLAHHPFLLKISILKSSATQKKKKR